jgi:hypothetical protein
MGTAAAGLPRPRRGSVTVRRRMDADAALAELTELSSQVEAAVVLDEQGVAGSTGSGTESLAAAADELLRAATGVRGDEPAVTRVEVMLPEASVFLVLEGDRRIVARTVPRPTPGLVVHDLRACLRQLAAGEGLPDT